MREQRPSDPVAAAVTVFRLSILLLVAAGLGYLVAGSLGGGTQAGPWVAGYYLQGTPVSIKLGKSCETKAGIRSDEGAATCEGVRWTVARRPRTGHLIANLPDIQGHGTAHLRFTGQARAVGTTVYGRPGPATTTAVLAVAALLALSTVGLLTSAFLRLRPAHNPVRRRTQPPRRPSEPRPSSVQPTWTPPAVPQPAPTQPAMQPALHQSAPHDAARWPKPAQPRPAWRQPAPERPAWQQPASHQLDTPETATRQPTWQQPESDEPAWPHPMWSQPASHEPVGQVDGQPVGQAGWF